jgi:predicted RNA binding protein YcfA (HicA-like mRNA interferase family)
MSRLTPLPWGKLVCVFEQLGYKRAGQKGSHIKLEKPGCARPLIVPKYDEVGLDIITNLMRTAGIRREAFFALLQNCR